MNGTHGFLRIIRGGALERLTDSDYAIVTLSVGGDTAKAGHVVTMTGETEPNVDLAITTDNQVYGVILEPVFPDNIAAYDIDKVITDGEKVRVLKVGFGRRLGVQVAMISDASQGAVLPGDQIILGANAGQVQKWAYLDAASETDTLEEFVGISAQTLADDANTKILIVEV